MLTRISEEMTSIFRVEYLEHWRSGSRFFFLSNVGWPCSWRCNPWNDDQHFHSHENLLYQGKILFIWRKGSVLERLRFSDANINLYLFWKQLITRQRNNVVAGNSPKNYPWYYLKKKTSASCNSTLILEIFCVRYYELPGQTCAKRTSVRFPISKKKNLLWILCFAVIRFGNFDWYCYILLFAMIVHKNYLSEGDKFILRLLEISDYYC